MIPLFINDALPRKQCEPSCTAPADRRGCARTRRRAWARTSSPGSTSDFRPRVAESRKQTSRRLLFRNSQHAFPPQARRPTSTPPRNSLGLSRSRSTPAASRSHLATARSDVAQQDDDGHTSMACQAPFPSRARARALLGLGGTGGDAVAVIDPWLCGFTVCGSVC